MRTMLASVAAALLSLSAPAAKAQDYPAQPITIVVPFAAGGGSDAIARVLADELSKRMDARFLIDNQGGAGTNLGNGIAAQAKPDGYTLLLGQVTLGINPALYPDLAYRVQDFVPIAFVASSPTVMVVNNESPAKSLEEFVALAKAEPDAFNFASGGSGTSVHLAGELFQTKTGTQMVHVPYRGSGPAVADLIGGQVQVMFDTAASATSQVKGGSLRALAVTGETRFPELPDVPTFAEAGLPGFDVSAWYGLMGPKGTPDAVVTKLNGEINALLADPAVQARFLAMGAQTSTKTPAEFRTFVDGEIERWGTVVRDSKITLE